MTVETLTSAQNPKVKRLIALQKDSSLRRESGLFVVEGHRELRQCLDAGYSIEALFVCREIAGDEPVLPKGLSQNPSGAKMTKNAPEGSVSDTFGGTPEACKRVFEVSPEIYEKIAYRGGTEGVMAEVQARKPELRDLKLPENPLIVVLESVEKPGNLGAVLRSADAAGADAVLVCNPLTDLFNPNLIRASIGACFTVPTVACTSSEAINWLKDKGIRILTAQLQDSSLYYDCDMRRGTALVMGTESTGLSDEWRRAADAHIRIPMLGRLDSLNVSVSASILLFEAVRQRQ